MNNYTLKDCYICHAFGKIFFNSKDILESHINDNIKVDSSISIVSPMNKNCYTQSYLVKQCKHNNLSLPISEKLFKISSEKWSNVFKIEGIIEILKKTTTEFAVVLDGKDTCIVKDLDFNFINEFKKYKADIVYNAMNFKYPFANLETRQFLENNHFRYINAGLCIGYTDKLLQFYKECIHNIEGAMNGWNNRPSEQYVVRKTAVSSDIIVRCDYNNTLFNYPKQGVNNE